MKTTELHEAIMNRDECTFTEANKLVEYMIDAVVSGENPEEVLYEEGFEPDYFFDILPL